MKTFFVTSNNFSITDCNYGVTGELWRCLLCGFVQCVDIDDTLPFYESLEDEAYETARDVRSLQFRRLVKYIKGYRSSGSILDIGAGSGIFVEEALREKYKATGLEPCRWLQKKAEARMR